jgi:hypothetical protein
MSEKQNGLVKKIARLDSNTKLPGHFIRKAVFPLDAVVRQHLPEGYRVRLKVEQGTYLLHHRLESLM